MSEALLLVAEGYEQIAAGIRKMVAAQNDISKKEEKGENGKGCFQWDKRCVFDCTLTIQIPDRIMFH